MIPLVNQVLRQTTARVFRGVTDTPGKIVSVFEPTAEIIRKGKANKPTEFGKLVKIQEAENQIITHYAVCRRRPAGHLSRKLCLRDSCRGLETGLEYGIELVKHGGDIPGQAFPSTLLERRNGKAQLEL